MRKRKGPGRWRSLAELGLTLAVTYTVGKCAVYAAYLERGYEAMGGEYLLNLLTCVAAYKVIHHIFDVLEAERREYKRSKERGNRSAAGIQDNR
ncbi:MAG: hypothetical protein HFI89_06335 [Lachnospiraceae bacterium]|nr:hypothetical protein [Lachnospiraceae bacterium]